MAFRRSVRATQATSGCEGLAEAAASIVNVEVRATRAEVPLLSPDDVALAACLRLATGTGASDEPAPLVQVLVCNATTDRLDVPLAASGLVAGLRLVDPDGVAARRLTLDDPVSNGSFVADLPPRTCLLAEQGLPSATGADGELRVEATLAVAWGVDEGGGPPPQALTTPETIEQVVPAR